MHAIELGSRLQLEHGNFGNYKGYDILVNDFNQGFAVYPIITFRFENRVNQFQIKKMKEYTKKLGAIQVDKSGYSLNLICSSLYGKVKEEKINDVIARLDNFIEGLKTYEMFNLTSCVICRQNKEGEELENHIVNDRLILCHGSCFEEYKGYHLNQIAKNEANVKNYPKSILYTILMAIVGFLPFFLVILFSGYMFGILFVLIPILAAWGYKKGQAPLNKKATLIIILASVAVMILGVFGMLGLSFEGYNLLLQEEGKEAIQFSEFIAACVGDIVYCLIFGALGILWSYRTITKDNNENKVSKLR